MYLSIFLILNNAYISMCSSNHLLKIDNRLKAAFNKYTINFGKNMLKFIDTICIQQEKYSVTGRK